jgi:selenocysteine-specific elongation factor
VKHFLLGTAGHVDHGKTSLIHALTQIDTDRLPEEKERGLSIDLGFAPLQLEGPPGHDSIALGVVDVPGHQRFLRNMIAGVGGFDAALLVVDPVEGVKPQTREHLAILDLLQTPRGLVVLSKADRSDEDTLELARWELAELLEGTFLEGAEMVVTSIQDPSSVERLKGRLYELFRTVEPRRSSGVGRLPVDRAFSKTGFGSVVTGSLWSGSLQVGAEVEVMPHGERGKIRGLQVHGQAVDQAVAGQRVAVNLSGLERVELVRGSTLVSPPGVLPKGERFGVSLRLLEPSPELLARKFRATFFQATGHATVRVNLVAAAVEDREVFGQLSFEQEAFLCPGDRFLLRDETDRAIVGGGCVLAIDSRPFQRRQSKSWLRRYQNLAGGGQIGAVLSALQAVGGSCKEAALRKSLGWPPADWDALRPTLVESGRVRWSGGDKVWDEQAFQELAGKTRELLARLQAAAPWKPGWRREELGKLLGLKTGRDDGLTDLLEELVSAGELQRHGPLFAGAEHRPALPIPVQARADQLLGNLGADGASPRDWDVALAEVAQDARSRQMLEEHLLGLGRLERLTEKLVFLPAALEAARRTLAERSAGQPFTASEAREWLETSRKYIIPILEWMDQKAWTHRAGDHRVIGQG